MNGKRYWQTRDIAAIGCVTAIDVTAALRSDEVEAVTDLVIDSLDEFAVGRIHGGCLSNQNCVFDPVRQSA